MSVTVPDIVAAMRDRIIDQVPGLHKVHYPAPNKLEASPSMVLYWGGGANPTTIVHRSNQEWSAEVMGRILITYEQDTPAELARIDSLITPVIDAFAIGPGLLSINDFLPEALQGHVNRCQVTDVRPSGQTTFAGDTCYVADLMFTVVFHRRPTL